VTPANQTIAKNTTLQYTATGTFSDGTTQDITQQATWSSSNTERATVSNASGTKGLATGVSAGTANIRAALLGKTGQTQLTVSNATLVSITVTPANPTVAKTFKVQLTATGTFSDGTTQVLTGVAWTSSNTAIATVNASGLATGKAAGTATITATKTGVSASTLLTVTSATLSSIAVTPATLTLASGQSSQLAATGTFSDGTTLDLTTQVSWTSSSKKTVSVNGSGRIKANKTGTATISAAKTGTTGTAVITVP
jgi:uncharacterized protein YjdB